MIKFGELKMQKKIKIEYCPVSMGYYNKVGKLITSNISENDKEIYKKLTEAFSEVMKQEIKDGKVMAGKLEITLQMKLPACAHSGNFP